jgi:HK97 family phage major capsid protein
MKTLRRTIHPQVRVLDARSGLVEYVASDESLDSYNEIVRADGARFNRFQKNAPFVDSHNYESIDCLLGKVVDFRVQNRKVVETVQWAIDVQSNLLAQKGFEMTSAGYLKAVSIGFIPISILTKWDSDSSDFREALEDLRVPAGTDVRTIYMEWDQLELSACVIGANPNAVAQIEKAYKDGLLKDSDITTFSKMSPEFGSIFERQSHRPRTYSFSTPPPSDGIEKMCAALGIEKSPTNHHSQLTMKTTESFTNFSQLSLKTKAAFGDIEMSRRDAGNGDLEQAVRRASALVANEKRSSYGDPIERYLAADPERRYFWNGFARKLAGRFQTDSPEYRALKNARQRAVSGIDLNDSFGGGLLYSVPIADEVYDLLLHYGAYKYLGLRKLIGKYMQFPKATGFPNAIFITPTQQGKTTIPSDTSMTGAGLTPEANTIAALIDASYAWLQDEKVDLSYVILSKFIQGLSQRIDYGCFQGNGQDDVNNGLTRGIFFDPAIATVKASPGAADIAAINRQDFINVTAAVAPAALQRMEEQPPRWYICPTLIPKYLSLWDGNAKNYLLKTPVETGGEWTLIGFPVTWAAQAPSAIASGAKVAAFGNPDAYLVALHEDFEIKMSDKGIGFPLANVQFRATGRGQSILREVTGFATLALP